MDFDNESPLNRIKGESLKANSSLHDYWLMGGGRSLDKLMALYLNPTEPLLKAPPTTKINTLKTWSQKLHWQARIKRQKEIDDAIALERFRERHMGADEVMARLADMARADLSQIPKFENIQELDGHPLSHTIKKYKITKRRKQDDTEIINIEIELNDPQGALDKLAKILSLYDQAGVSDDKPLVIKVLKGVSTDDL